MDFRTMAVERWCRLFETHGARAAGQEIWLLQEAYPQTYDQFLEIKSYARYYGTQEWDQILETFLSNVYESVVYGAVK